MADTKIPFKYCRIERAANLLGCEIEDLVTLGLENKISLNLMLDGIDASIIIDGNIETAKQWREKLEPTHKYLAPAVGITEYSYFSFDVLQVDEDYEPIWIQPFYPLGEKDDMCVTCVGRTYGLWRLTRGIDQLLNYRVAYISGSGFSPCHPDENNLALQLMIYKKHEKDEDEMTDEEFWDAHRGSRITDKDLWLTSFDIRRLLDCEDDYYSLGELDKANENSHKNLILNSPHPTAERHALNREQIFKAALRFREEQPNVFEQACRKTDNTINFSALARELMDRPNFFINHEIPIKTQESIAGILSKAYKSPIK
ncbi:hypothetical protein ABLB69_19875 [Xenorhabdus khoisanae]|uniref:hypothetical protein n=1 Tax=Xenorhabdus khoisanae TaxID=880157 RepID=UPI0032B8227B